MNDYLESIRQASTELPQEPPCVKCKWWKPEKVFTPMKGFVGSQFGGTRCCWANTQFSDFSCFEEVDEK